MLFLQTLIAGVLATDVSLVTLPLSALNLPKVQVYEFWDSKAKGSGWSIRSTQADAARWTAVGKAFCISGAWADGLVPLQLWIRTQPNINQLNYCMVSTNELWNEGLPAIGTKDRNRTGNSFLYMGYLGFVAKDPQPGMVPLHRFYEPSLGKHYFSLDKNNGFKGQQKVQPFDTTNYRNYEGIAGYVWATC